MKILGFMVKILFFFFVNKFSPLIILGRNTMNFTATNQLFLNNLEETSWRFEVVYTFEHETSLSALNFKINPKTQIALHSYCQGNCKTNANITWNIYYASTNSSSNISQWILYNETTKYENNWFYGKNLFFFFVNKFSLLIIL